MRCYEIFIDDVCNSTCRTPHTRRLSPHPVGLAVSRAWQFPWPTAQPHAPLTGAAGASRCTRRNCTGDVNGTPLFNAPACIRECCQARRGLLRGAPVQAPGQRVAAVEPHLDVVLVVPNGGRVGVEVVTAGGVAVAGACARAGAARSGAARLALLLAARGLPGSGARAPWPTPGRSFLPHMHMCMVNVHAARAG